MSSRENFETLQTPALSHLTTFGGNPAVMAAGLATIEQMHEGLFQNVIDTGTVLDKGISELVQQFPRLIDGISGLGLMRGLWLMSVDLTEEFYKRCRSKGLLLHFKLNAGRCLRMSPPLVISERGIMEAIDIMADVCLEMSE